MNRLTPAPAVWTDANADLACVPYEINYDNEVYEPDVDDFFATVYVDYKPEHVSEFGQWLVKEVCCQEDVDTRTKWGVFIKCISGVPVLNMDVLNAKIEEECLKLVSPSCWQEWKLVPTWCECVTSAFREWQQQVNFTVDERKIHGNSILGSTSERTFGKVKTVIDGKIQGFRNWNHFAFTLLRVCYDHFMPGRPKLEGDYLALEDDFERDKGADYNDPYYKDL